MQSPYVGAVVQYRYKPTDAPSDAIVTRVHDDTWVGLFIILPDGLTRTASHVERGVWMFPDAP
jgi:hypothetical protein